MADKIINYIILYLPVIMAGFCAIISGFKIVGNCKEWKDALNENNIKQLNNDLKAVVKDNLALKDNIAKVLAENESLKTEIANQLKTLDLLLNQIVDKAKEEQIEEETEESPKEE